MSEPCDTCKHEDTDICDDCPQSDPDGRCCCSTTSMPPCGWCEGSKWDETETLIERNDMDKNYEAIVQVRKDGKIVGSLNNGVPITLIAKTERDAEGKLNRDYSTAIKALEEKGELEFIIRPFLASKD